MYLRRGAFAAFKSLGRVNTLSPRSHVAVANMSSSNFRRQPQSEEEIVFSGRAGRGGQLRKERMSGRASIPDSRPPPSHRPGSGNSSYRDERGSRSGGGGVALPPQPRTPEAWRNSYHANSGNGRYGDAGREGQGWHGDSGRSHRSDGYRASGYENTRYRDAEPARPISERDVRSSRRDHYNYASAFAGGGALRSHTGAIYGSDVSASRNDRQYHHSPPPAEDEREHAFSSYHSAPSTHQSYDRYQALERACSPPQGRDHPESLPQRPSGGYNYRSDRRQPPLSSCGLLSSSQFSQGIGKHSRYSPPASIQAFGTTATTTANKRARKLDKKARKREAALLNPTPPIRCSSSPTPERLPPSKTILPIPEPTPSYLDISLLPSPRLPEPTRHLIILDLNGTLLAREKGKAKSGSVNPTPRPGLALFLTYVFARFNVMVWSSAQPENVQLMVGALFSNTQKRALLACWGRDTLGLTKSQFAAKTQVYKRLERVWTSEYRVLHDTHDGQWSQRNTLLLDDSRAKARGQPWNHVEVPEFLGTACQRVEDRALWALTGYLEECRWRGNVSAFIRETPFEVESEWQAAGEQVLGEFEDRSEEEEEARECEGV